MSDMLYEVWKSAMSDPGRGDLATFLRVWMDRLALLMLVVLAWLVIAGLSAVALFA